MLNIRETYGNIKRRKIEEKKRDKAIDRENGRYGEIKIVKKKE